MWTECGRPSDYSCSKESIVFYHCVREQMRWHNGAFPSFVAYKIINLRVWLWLLEQTAKLRRRTNSSIVARQSTMFKSTNDQDLNLAPHAKAGRVKTGQEFTQITLGPSFTINSSTIEIELQTTGSSIRHARARVCSVKTSVIFRADSQLNFTHKFEEPQKINCRGGDFYWMFLSSIKYLGKVCKALQGPTGSQIKINLKQTFFI